MWAVEGSARGPLGHMVVLEVCGQGVGSTLSTCDGACHASVTVCVTHGWVKGRGRHRQTGASCKQGIPQEGAECVQLLGCMDWHAKLITWCPQDDLKCRPQLQLVLQ